MYGAYECPHCVEANKTVKEIQRELSENLCFVFRHFPRPDVHPHAEAAAVVAETAGAQGKFWQMHDALFEHYNRLDGDHLLHYAKELGLDMDEFDNEIAQRLYFSKVREDLESGLMSGVKGTPTFFINGFRYFGSYNEEILLAALRNKIKI
jgi:protein-disulfide isomerase